MEQCNKGFFREHNPKPNGMRLWFLIFAVVNLHNTLVPTSTDLNLVQAN